MHHNSATWFNTCFILYFPILMTLIYFIALLHWQDFKDNIEPGGDSGCCFIYDILEEVRIIYLIIENDILCTFL